MGKFIRHEPCPKCGSRDALARYEDGTGYCWSCTSWFKADEEDVERDPAPPKDDRFLEGTCQELSRRHIRQETCEKYGYMLGTNRNGESVQIANYRNAKGTLVAQKIRGRYKKFSVVGAGKDMPLFGQHLWSSGKYIVITEGEIDCLSVAQAMSLKWPVVSIPNGAQSADKALAHNLEWLLRFETIVLMFDEDEPGRKAVEKAAAVLPVGRVKVAKLPGKDPNEVLIEHGPKALLDAFWNAQPWRPDGIRSLAEFAEDLINPKVEEGIPWPFPGIQEKLGPLLEGRMYTLTAGSGLGKTTLAKEIAYHLAVTHKKPVGMLMLEEPNEETVASLASIYLNKNIILDPLAATKEEREEALYTLTDGVSIYLYDHFGSNDIDTIINKIRYLVHACGVRWVVLDHISILISGLESTDERKLIDVAMTKLRTLVSELKIGLILISHLKRPEGDKGHEDGAEVRLGQLRGSHSIGQLSDAVIGLQKPKDDPYGDEVEPVVLKARRGGRRGRCATLQYNIKTNRLLEQVQEL